MLFIATTLFSVIAISFRLSRRYILLPLLAIVHYVFTLIHCHWCHCRFVDATMSRLLLMLIVIDCCFSLHHISYCLHITAADIFSHIVCRDAFIIFDIAIAVYNIFRMLLILLRRRHFSIDIFSAEAPRLPAISRHFSRPRCLLLVDDDFRWCFSRRHYAACWQFSGCRWLPMSADFFMPFRHCPTYAAVFMPLIKIITSHHCFSPHYWLPLLSSLLLSMSPPFFGCLFDCHITILLPVIDIIDTPYPICHILLAIIAAIAGCWYARCHYCHHICHSCWYGGRQLLPAAVISWRHCHFSPTFSSCLPLLLRLLSWYYCCRWFHHVMLFIIMILFFTYCLLLFIADK